MDRVVSVTYARVHLRELLSEIERNPVVIVIARYGKPVAVLRRPDGEGEQ